MINCSSLTRIPGMCATAIVFVLLGCGGGGGGGGGGSASPSATSTSSVTPTPIVVPSPSASNTPIPTYPPEANCNPASSNGLTLSLCSNRYAGVAPMAAFFDATGTSSLSVTSQPFHNIKYTWDFGDDATHATWAYGARPNVLSKNIAYGAVAAHVFETPGVYTVKLTAFDGINTKSVTTYITVGNPIAQYSGVRTVCVANGILPIRGENGCPSDADVRNFSDIAQLATLTRIGSVRILLKRGDSWDVVGTAQMNTSNGMIGAYGVGPAPLIRQVSSNYALFLVGGASNWVFMDLEFTGVNGFVQRTIQTGDSLGSNILMLRIRSTNTAGIEVSGNGVFLVDSNLSEFAGGSGYVGFYSAEGSQVAVLGNRIYDATHIEHNIRLQGSTKAVISDNTIALPADNKSAVTVRGRTVSGRSDTWSGVWIEDVIVSDNEIISRAGASWPVQFAPQNTISNERLRDVILERNIIRNGLNPLVASEVISGFTARNNLMYAIDQNSGFLIAHRNSLIPAPSGSYIYNNTLYNASGLHSYFSFVSLNMDAGTGSEPTGTIIKNNLIYAPSASPVNLVSSISSPIWIASNNSTDSQIVNTWPGYTVPPVSLSDWTPISGSYGYGAGAAVPVWDDFYLSSRPAISSLGAVSN